MKRSPKLIKEIMFDTPYSYRVLLLVQNLRFDVIFVLVIRSLRLNNRFDTPIYRGIHVYDC